MQQLSGLDASFIYGEQPHAPTHITAIMLYDPSTAPGGEVSFDRITEHLYQMRTFAAQKMLGKVLDAAVLTDDGIVYSLVSTSMLMEAGADHEDLEEVVGALRAVDRCQVAALLKEQRDGSFRLSLRSPERFQKINSGCASPIVD